MSKKLLFGTHNSGTSSKLVWWQYLFAPIMHLTSRCQSRSISEQISDGIVLFNFQICYYRGDWHFSHGLCIYEDKLFDALRLINEELSRDIDKKIYIQISLDKNFLVGQDKIEFDNLVSKLLDEYKNYNEFIYVFNKQSNNLTFRIMEFDVFFYCIFLNLYCFL